MYTVKRLHYLTTTPFTCVTPSSNTLHVELIMTDTIMVFYFPDNIVVVHFFNSDWVCKNFKTKSSKTAQPCRNNPMNVSI